MQLSNRANGDETLFVERMPLKALRLEGPDALTPIQRTSRRKLSLSFDQQ